MFRSVHYCVNEICRRGIESVTHLLHSFRQLIAQSHRNRRNVHFAEFKKMAVNVNIIRTDFFGLYTGITSSSSSLTAGAGGIGTASCCAKGKDMGQRGCGQCICWVTMSATGGWIGIGNDTGH
jgi:hypothetical protein